MLDTSVLYPSLTPAPSGWLKLPPVLPPTRISGAPDGVPPLWQWQSVPEPSRPDQRVSVN